MWLELDSVTRRFGARLALDGVDLALEQGEIGCLLGPSGSGKTTALRCIAGFETLDAGRILCAGRTLSAPGEQLPPEQRGVGVVFQDLALFPHLSVRGNVEFGLRRLPRRERRARADEMLNLVGLADRADSWPSQLSGGQQQRVALARALAPRPSVLLLDEAFSSLDSTLREQLVPEVRRLLKSQGITALAVSHDQHDAFALADRVAVMRDGRLEQWATPQELYHRPATRFVAGFVGHATLLPATRLPGGNWSTELGELPAACVLGARATAAAAALSGDVQRCELMLRPDDVALDPGSPVQGKVLRRDFRGAHFLYTFGLPSGRQLLALASSQLDQAPAATVGLRLNETQFVAFTGHPDAH